MKKSIGGKTKKISVIILVLIMLCTTVIPGKLVQAVTTTSHTTSSNKETKTVETSLLQNKDTNIKLDSDSVTKVSSLAVTNDSTIKVSAPNELAVITEMLGGNVVSSAEATLDTNPSTLTMPQFLLTFGISNNNVNADPWMTHYNPANGYGGTDKTNYGWNGYAGGQLKPISNSTPSTLPTYADALNNNPDLVVQFPVPNDITTSNNNGYYGVNEAGFKHLKPTVDYYVTNNLPTPDDIKNTVSTIAEHLEDLIDEGKTTRYGEPMDIAESFNDYYDSNIAKAKALTVTSGLTKKNVIHVTGYSAGSYTVIPNGANDIYGTTYINQAGGKNVAVGTNPTITMTASQIAAALGSNGVITTINSSLYNTISLDTTLNSIPHYAVPTGVYLWSVRSPEGALAPLWLAKVLHGSETVTYGGTTGTVGNFINVHDLTYNFYSTYYHYNTNAVSYNSLINVVNNILPSNTGSTHTMKYAAPKPDTTPPVTPSHSTWADPVETSTGSHKIDTTALKISGGRDFQFDLSYDSSNLVKGTMGKGWYNNYEKRIEKQSDGSLYYYSSPSSYIQFTESSTAGVFTTTSLGRNNWIITRNGDGSYVLNCNNDEKYFFDSTGKLTKVQNRTNMSVNISHDASGNMIITEPVSGKSITASYNSSGFVYKVSDSAGRTVNFTYSSDNCLTGIKDANGKNSSYSYDVYGHVLTGTDGDNVKCFTDTYDSEGRIISQKDALDKVTTFSYDDTSVAGQTTVTIKERNGSTRKNVFNDKKQLISVTDENGNVTSYSYDSNGNISKENNAIGGIVTKTYDSKNNLLTYTDEAAAKTIYTYDGSGNMLTKKNPDGAVTTNTYDGNNRITKTVDVRGTTTTYSYNGSGLLTGKTAAGSNYTYTYENGLLKTAKDPREEEKVHLNQELDIAQSSYLMNWVKTRMNSGVLASYALKLM